MPLNWTAMSDALHDWAALSSGLVAIWSDQDAKQPPGSYITLRYGAFVPMGANDSVAYRYDAGAVAGQEIEYIVIGRRRFTVSVQVFTGSTLDETSALAVASKLAASLALPSVGQTFQNAGFSCYGVTSAQNLSAIEEADFEGRSTFELECYTRETLSERTGYIGSVQVQIEQDQHGQVLLVSTSTP